ncbi:Glucan endo-13-alpha-glucosidase agn1 [Fusarium albosuccineum]|uniref:Glucan endo-13-alpha-glucosidase agn1 n=1 Tax=Fusarium albosuccineum TaxID=1237068 RepID=A0A8H4L545_9HYPO|nr:Glucan endo-13-alpha-glucosidase agn1 [Fusarium albosuccineum]
MRWHHGLFVVASALSLVAQASAKAAIAHYMLGQIDEDHVKKDLKDAKDAGFDAFALNVGCVDNDWVDDVLGYLFNNAAGAGMSVYLNLDLYAAGDACYNGAKCCNYAHDYTNLWNKYKGSDGYFKIGGKNVVSTFSAANWSAVEFTEWRDDWDNGDLFFIPDFDHTDGYWEAAAGWCYPGDVGIDAAPFQGALAHKKEYMIPISPLQYKNAYNTSLYRLGDANLPVRMEGILAMSPRPNYVQFQTWNDGPESHYIGNIWPEQNHEYQPWKYMNPDRYDHSAWQPLVRSFNDAFKKEGATAANMAPSGSKLVEGAIWYPSFPRDTDCQGPDGFYSEKPINYKAGTEGVYFALVMKQGLPSGYTLKIFSGNTETPAVYDLKAGLNYGSAEALNKGAQYLEILDPSGKRVAYSDGGMCVTPSCPRGIYSRNYHVVAILEGDTGATCTPWPNETDEPNSEPEPDFPPELLPDNDPNLINSYSDIRWQNAQGCVIFDPPGIYEDAGNDCTKPCKEVVDKAKEEGRTTSMTCIGFWPPDEPIPWAKVDQESYRVTRGKCVCDNPAVNLIGDTFLEALPIIAQVGCYVLMSSLQLVLEIGEAAIPEGKAVGQALEMAIDAAKLANYVYEESEDPSGAFSTWLSPCGDTSLVPDDFIQLFETLNAVADAVTGFEVPSKIKKGSGKKGDDGNPRSGTTPSRPKDPPELPTVETCKDHLHRPARSLFYSGPKDQKFHQKARTSLSTRTDILNGYGILSDTWKDQNYKEGFRGTDKEHEFFAVCSQSFAEVSSGIVYVMLPKTGDDAGLPGSIWNIREFTALKKNPDVKEIRRLNPDDDIGVKIWP